jgi:hypothetical protein
VNHLEQTEFWLGPNLHGFVPFDVMLHLHSRGRSLRQRARCGWGEIRSHRPVGSMFTRLDKPCKLVLSLVYIRRRIGLTCCFYIRGGWGLSNYEGFRDIRHKLSALVPCPNTSLCSRLRAVFSLHSLKALLAARRTVSAVNATQKFLTLFSSRMIVAVHETRMRWKEHMGTKQIYCEN